MRWLLDLAAAFLVLGLVEALVKPLARRFVQRRSGAELEQVVRQKLEALTGESWKGEDLGPPFALFDPRAAADHALGQMNDAAFARWLK